MAFTTVYPATPRGMHSCTLVLSVRREEFHGYYTFLVYIPSQDICVYGICLLFPRVLSNFSFGVSH